MENIFKIDSGLRLRDDTQIMDYDLFNNFYIAWNNKQSYAQALIDTYRVICGYHYPFVAKTSYIGVLDVFKLPLLSRQIIFRTFYNDNCHLLLKILAGTICFPFEIVKQLLAIALTIAFYPLVVIIHTMKLIVYSKQDASLIMSAARYHDIDILMQLISTGINNYDRKTTLDLFYSSNEIDSVKYLINASYFNDRERSAIDKPLICAAHAGKKDSVEELIKSGEDLNAKSKDGYTALMLAILCRHTNIARLLIRANAAVDLRDNHDYTALMLVVKSSMSPNLATKQLMDYVDIVK